MTSDNSLQRRYIDMKTPALETGMTRFINPYLEVSGLSSATSVASTRKRWCASSVIRTRPGFALETLVQPVDTVTSRCVRRYLRGTVCHHWLRSGFGRLSAVAGI